MSYTCKDLFMRCWWRNQYLPCCDIFTVQWSEYGSCYSFNSATSAPSSEVNVSMTELLLLALELTYYPLQEILCLALARLIL